MPLLVLGGRLTEGDMRSFLKEFESVRAGAEKAVILDLSGVNFIDSQGLGKIVSVNALMERSGRKLYILLDGRTDSRYLADLFSMTNLDKILTIVATLDEIG